MKKIFYLMALCFVVLLIAVPTWSRSKTESETEPERPIVEAGVVTKYPLPPKASMMRS